MLYGTALLNREMSLDALVPRKMHTLLASSFILYPLGSSATSLHVPCSVFDNKLARRRTGEYAEAYTHSGDSCGIHSSGAANPA